TPKAREAGAAAVRCRPRDDFLAAVAAADRVTLFAGQAFELGGVGGVLDPAVVDDGGWGDGLSAPAGVAGAGGVRVGALICRQEHPAYDRSIGRVAVAVGIGIDDEQLVRELARDVGVVAAALLGAEVDTVAAGVARKALHERVRCGVDDRDRGCQRV